MQAFKLATPDSRKFIVPLALMMKQFEQEQSSYPLDPAAFSIHGSLILQHLFQFPAENNSSAVSSFLDLSSEDLKLLATHPMGGRAMEAFITSTTIGHKPKRKLLRNLAGQLADLAKDKYGSHVVDKLWANAADIDDKEKMAEELLQHLTSLQNNHHGKFIVRNCRLENFKRERENWRKREAGNDRRKEMFKMFMDDEGEKAGQQKKADPLLESKAYDGTMKSLGFAEVATEKPGKDNEKKDKKKHKKPKTDKKKGTGEESLLLDADLDGVAEFAAKPSETKKSSKKDAGLDFILDAVAKTAGKKRKGGDGGGEDDGGEKKKKKFMS